MSNPNQSFSQTAGENAGSRLSRNLDTVARTDRDFKGDVPELGVVGIPLEASNLTHGKTYPQFTINLMNYSGRTLNNGDRLKPLIEDLKDPIPDFELERPVAPKKPKKRSKAIRKQKEKERAERRAKKEAAKKAALQSGSVVGPDDSDSDSDTDSDDEEAYQTEKHVWGLRMKKFVDSVDELGSNIRKHFSVIMGQCTIAMQERLKTELEFEVRRKKSDTLWLLTTLKKIMTGLQDSHHPYMLAVSKLKTFANCIQKGTETNEAFKQRCTDALQSLKVALGCDILKNIDVGDNLSGQAVEDSFMAAYILSQADRVRHGERVTELEKDYEVGQNNIPDKPPKAFEILVNNEERLRSSQRRYRRPGGGNRGTNFLQDGGGGYGSGRPARAWPEGVERVPGTNGTLTIIQCRHCNKWGHKAYFCPTRDNGVCPPTAGTANGGTGNANGGNGAGQVSNRTKITNSFLLNTMNDVCIKTSRYYLDTGATHSTTVTKLNATNLRQLLPSTSFYANTNAGEIVYDMAHDLDFLLLTAYHNPNSVANVLAAHELDRIPGAHVYHDRSKDPDYYVIFEEGRVMKFTRCKEGLYYYDTAKPEDHEFHLGAVGINMMQTVTQKAKSMSKKAVAQAIKARTYHELLAWPATETFKKWVRDDFVDNIDISVEDIDRANELFGEPVAILREKMKRPHPHRHKHLKTIPLPEQMYEIPIDLYIDIMEIQGCMFLVAKSRKISYTSSYPIPNKRMKTILERVQNEQRKYRARGVKIATIHIGTICCEGACRIC